ncbi:MAG: hypothetical protein EPO35_01635 [Acidobacteria bacterium]|nr:MAG: hypothetical protein EPO35_01635 [Acidobacteriota bacterium]
MLAIANYPSPIAHGQAPVPPKRPDFSGTWVFDADATDAASSPERQGTNIFGASFVAHQDARTLTFDITVAANTPVVKASYALDGTPTKNVSPPQLPGAAPIVVTATARWINDTLVIESRSQQPGGRGRGDPKVVDVVSTRTIWLDGSGQRLVIDREGTPRQVVPTTRSVYSRK